MQILEEMANDRCITMDFENSKRRSQLKVQRRSDATSFKDPYLHGLLRKQRRKKRSTISSNGGAAREGGVRTRRQPKHRRLLRKIVHKTQAQWQVEDYNRLIRLERFHRKPLFSYGNPKRHPSFHEKGNVCFINRLYGCVLSSHDGPLVQRLHESCPFRKSSKIPCHAHGTECVCEGIHKSNSRPDEVSENQRMSHECLYRRLVQQKPETEFVELSDPENSGDLHLSGIIDQLRKVGVRRRSNKNICGDTVRLQEGSGTSTPRETDRIRKAHKGPNTEERSLGENLVTLDWQDGQYGKSSENGSSTQKTHSETPTVEVESNQAELGAVCTSREVGTSTLNLVDEQEEYRSGSSSNTVQTRRNSIHRCQQLGLRGDSGESGDVRKMDGERVQDALKQSRDVGHLEGSESLSRPLQGETAHDLLGQHNYGGLNKQTRRHQSLESDQLSLEALAQVGQVELCSKSKTHSGETEREGRCHVQNESSPSNRMVLGPSPANTSMENMGVCDGRPVCDLPQPQATEVCVTSPGRVSLGDRRNEPGLEQVSVVRISPVEHAGRNNTKDSGRQSGGDTNSPKMGEKKLVPTSSRPRSRPTNKTTNKSEHAHSTSHKSSLHKSQHVKPSRLEIIREKAVKQGFSEKVANRIANKVRPSSGNIYDSKWKRFSEWCENKQINPLKINVYQFTDFLNHLFEVEKLQVNTIKGYRTAVSGTLKLHGNKIGDDERVKDLIANFCLNRPVNRQLYPKWDLCVVLNALMKPPFEPISSASMIFVTKKTAFLLLLASGARRSEIHALDIKKFMHCKDPEKYWLAPNDTFLAKNFNTKTGKGDFKGFWIKNLKDFVGSDLEKDALLCPVRCLKEYLKRTRNKRGNVRQLFVNSDCASKTAKPVHMNTISAWIKSLVAYAYDTYTDGSGSLLNRAAHEIRAQAASYHLQINFSIEQIMEQCRWSQHTTFTNYYLRDVAGQIDGMLALPPLTAAGTIINQ